MRLPDLVRRTALRWGLGLAALLALAMASAFAIAYELGTSALFRAVDRSVLEQLELLAARPPDMLEFMITSRMNHQPAVITRVGLFRPDGSLIVGDLEFLPPGLPLNGKIHAITGRMQRGGDSEDLHVAARRLPDGRILLVGRNVAGALGVQRTLLWTLAIGLVVAVLVGLGVGAGFGLRAEQRLRRLGRVAEDIASGRLHARLPARANGDALDQLSLIFNRILERLESIIATLRHVGEDIAHDMRTPLTGVRVRLERARQDGRLNAAGQDVVDRAIEGIEQTLAIVASLLRIAEIEHGRRQSGFTTFDLAQVLAQTSDAFAPLAEDSGVTLAVDAIGPVAIHGDRTLIVEAVVNLVDNAVKFAGSGHHVVLGLGGSALCPVLCVSDDGPGIPVVERERVFHRFYRGDAGRTARGSGLGLSLVAAVARLHGFALRLLDNAPGCRVELDCWPTDGGAMGATRTPMSQ
ncbi:MAG TPA: ATP-binding protein [Acetobacteraceae bacterium]|nr:ATP-binding protein [Acetobacteraceae bacterium]